MLSDVTSLYAAINVVGPKAVELLSELTDESLSTHDFPQMTCKVSKGGGGQIESNDNYSLPNY